MDDGLLTNKPFDLDKYNYTFEGVKTVGDAKKHGAYFYSHTDTRGIHYYECFSAQRRPKAEPKGLDKSFVKEAEKMLGLSKSRIKYK